MTRSTRSRPPPSLWRYLLGPWEPGDSHSGPSGEQHFTVSKAFLDPPCLFNSVPALQPYTPLFQTFQKPQALVNLCLAPPRVRYQRYKCDLDATLALRSSQCGREDRELPGYGVGCHIATCMKLGAVMGEQEIGERGLGEFPEGGDVIGASVAGSARQVQETRRE